MLLIIEIKILIKYYNISYLCLIFVIKIKTMTKFSEFKELRTGQRIMLLELEDSYKQNVFVTENDQDKKILYVDDNPIYYSDIKFLDIIE